MQIACATSDTPGGLLMAHPTAVGGFGAQRVWLRFVLGERSVQLALAGWLLITLALPVLAGSSLPFDRPSVEGQSVGTQILNAQSNLILALLVMGLAYTATRHRVAPDIAARVPSRAVALTEVTLLVGYGILVQAVGVVVGALIGTYPISAHMPGSIYALRQPITPDQAVLWMVYNFVLYAAVPYLVFRGRGYSNEALGLRSSNRANDALLIVVVLVFEGVVELAFLGSTFFGLSDSQHLIGVPLSIAFNLFGTVLPVMIYLYAILLPRFLKLTGSIATTIILGGLGYAAMHTFDAWTVYDGLRSGSLSTIFLLLQYFGPGMVKSVLTLRTGNAWVHALAYHAIAPHATLDAPNLVRIFGVR
jgi:hypothetical protein